MVETLLEMLTKGRSQTLYAVGQSIAAIRKWNIMN